MLSISKLSLALVITGSAVGGFAVGYWGAPNLIESQQDKAIRDAGAVMEKYSEFIDRANQSETKSLKDQREIELDAERRRLEMERQYGK